MTSKSANTLDLTGRVAVVIGATSGLGRTIALGLASHGADVVHASFVGVGPGLDRQGGDLRQNFLRINVSKILFAIAI